MGYNPTYLKIRNATVEPALLATVTNLSGTIAVATTAQTKAGSNIATIADSSTVHNGMAVSGTGVPTSDTVVTVPDGTHFTIANNVTVDAPSTTVWTLTNTSTVNGAVASGKTIVVTDVSNLSTIQTVTGTNIAGGSTIVSINSGAKSFVLNNAVSGAVPDKAVLTFTQPQTLTADTPPGANILNMASVTSLAAGMQPASASAIPSGTTVSSINSSTKAITLSGNVISNVASGAVVNFTLPQFAGLNVTADTTTVSPTQTAVHITLTSKAGAGANMSLSAASLLSLGNTVATAFAQSNGDAAALLSVAALNNKVDVELLVNA